MTLTTARSLLLAATFGLGSAQAFAQGTPEQREACTPDALRLCSDTVPDVGRTTACMASHRVELSPRCRAAFDASSPAASPRLRVARRPQTPQPDAVTMREPANEAAPRRARAASALPAMTRRHTGHAVARGDRDTREARRVIGRLCASNVLDGGTCGFMGKVLTLAE